MTFLSDTVNARAPRFGMDIAAAWADALARNKKLYLPAGSYSYTGAGLTGSTIEIFGDGRGLTNVTLGASSRFLNIPTQLQRLTVKGVSFSGGIDVIRSTYTGANVTYLFVVEDCEFEGYTKAAISSNASDMPYWKISRCLFRAANDTTSMGVAFSGLADACLLEDNDFEKNRIHVKLRQAGNNATLRGNAFIRYSATGGSPRVDVWVVPQTSSVNAGSGFVISGGKLGNENLDAADYRILYADEDTTTGSDNGTYFPKLSLDSTGFIYGHQVKDVAHFGAAVIGTTSSPPLIYSTTPNVRDCMYGPVILGGAPPTYALQFRTAPTADRSNTENVFGPFLGADYGRETALPFPLSNGNGVGYALDPTGYFSGRPAAVPLAWPGAADPVDYVKLLPTVIRSFTTSNATKTDVADVYGGIDAASYEFTAAGGIVYGQLTMGNVVVGTPVWIEFDVKVGAATALTILRVDLETEGGAFHFRRTVQIPSTWKRIRYLHPGPRTASGQTDIVFSTNATETGKVQIGRVRVYHAREPQNVDGVTTFAGDGKMFGGAAAPVAGLGANGDYFLRSDTPGTANQRLYVKSAGTWTGIV